MLIKDLPFPSLDARRNLLIPGDSQVTLTFCIEHFIAVAQESITNHGAFHVALSGGSTPKGIFERLCQPPYQEQIDWKKVHLFWGDERSVPPEDPESNYHMAMQAGFNQVRIPKDQIHRMCAEKDIEANAQSYEKILRDVLKDRPFDFVMLGMGEDGHTASLFPNTAGLHAKDRLVVANFIPQKNTWRMTLTFDCINQASHITVYVLGASKKQMLAHVLLSKDNFELLPAQRLGTKEHKALWITDDAAADLIIKEKLKK